MSKQFAMLTATRRFENYLSRENYNLDRMAKNEKIPPDLFQKKVDHHNELVDALNDLFAALSDSPSSALFSRYELTSSETFEFIPDVVYAEQPKFDDRIVTQKTAPQVVTVAEDETENEIAAWEADGYASYEAWLADKEAEFVQAPDDLSLSVNDSLSRHRAQQALDEYKETSVRDIATYLPEEDHPVNVLPSDNADEEDSHEDDTHEVTPNGYDDEDSDALDLRYLDHTVDNVRVDNDPTQIAAVETAVERYGETSRQGTDIDLSSFLYKSDRPVVDDLISDDIRQLHVQQGDVEDVSHVEDDSDGDDYRDYQEYEEENVSEA